MESIFPLIGVFLGWLLGVLTNSLRERRDRNAAIKAIHLGLMTTRNNQLVELKSKLHAQISLVKEGKIHVIQMPFTFLSAFEHSAKTALLSKNSQQFLELLDIYQALDNLKNSVETWPQKISSFNPNEPLTPEMQEDLIGNINIALNNIDRAANRIDSYIKKYVDY